MRSSSAWLLDDFLPEFSNNIIQITILIPLFRPIKGFLYLRFSSSKSTNSNKRSVSIASVVLTAIFLLTKWMLYDYQNLCRMKTIQQKIRFHPTFSSNIGKLCWMKMLDLYTACLTIVPYLTNCNSFTIAEVVKIDNIIFVLLSFHSSSSTVDS